MLYNISLTLHLITAAAWFGLSLPLAARFRYLLEAEPPCRVDYIPGLKRTLTQLHLFLGLTLLFGLITLFAGGGFAAYGPRYHTAIFLLLIMWGLQFLLSRQAHTYFTRVIDSEQVSALPVKQIAMFNGINHLLWLFILVLMLWHRFHT